MPDDTDATPQAAQPEQDDAARAVSRAIDMPGGDYAEGDIYKGHYTHVVAILTGIWFVHFVDCAS